MAHICPALANVKRIAPSFAGTSNNLDPIITWPDGLDTDEDVTVAVSVDEGET
jgi:hypothetical protein